MIAGFVIDGQTPQTTLLRGVGPELHNYGIPSDRCEVDPRLELRRAGADPILLANDNWWTGSGATETAARAALQGAFPLTTGGTDAATVADLAPGAYTMVMRSALPEKRGVALAEVYGQHLLNISTRGTVGAGDNVLIAGFTIDTPEPLSVLVRAIGPTLTSYGVGGALANPTLTVYRQLPNGDHEVVATNDNWSEDAKASLTNDAALQTGAFLLNSGSKDAAVFLQLPAGSYSAVVSSADATEGVAMVEVYAVKW